MAFQIRIVPDALREAAGRQRTTLMEVADTGERIDALTAMLNEAWDGNASTQALRAMRDIASAVGEISEAGNTLTERLERIAQAFEAVDGMATPIAAVIGDISAILSLFPELGSIWANGIWSGGSVRIVPDEVRVVAAECLQCADILTNAGADLRANASSLSAEWEGRAYTKYMSDCDEVYTAVKHVTNSLQGISAQLRAAADRYEELDNML